MIYSDVPSREEKYTYEEVGQAVDAWLGGQPASSNLKPTSVLIGMNLTNTKVINNYLRGHYCTYPRQRPRINPGLKAHLVCDCSPGLM